MRLHYPRKDGHHPIIFMQCGPVRHHVDAKTQAAARPFEHVVMVCPTAFQTQTSETDARQVFHELYSELAADPVRNRLICDDVLASVHEGRFPAVLTECNEHLDVLASELSGKVDDVIVLRGGMRKRALNEVMVRLGDTTSKHQRVILATGRFIGEGFDDPLLDTLFLTLPVSWRGTIVQYVGRLHRLHNRKREVRVYDYADLNVSMLARMFNRRCRGYEAVGYTIQLPASAVAGWPTGVALPVDPAWKRDYAGSVRRLICDEVDLPLANLFYQATQVNGAQTTGVARARSASEAFLFRRLETLPQTAGRFRLNTRLPIPFAGSGHMEVDFLSTDHHIVIEVDGHQHLGDPGAYRRDRSKDALLQEHGYFVVRFLAEDLGKQLDDVLDAILRAVSHRSKVT